MPRTYSKVTVPIEMDLDLERPGDKLQHELIF